MTGLFSMAKSSAPYYGDDDARPYDGGAHRTDNGYYDPYYDYGY